MEFAMEDIYLKLDEIQGVLFTRRELDIAACILSGRTAKKIASLLSISSKTVENHIRNIMLKLGVRTQEGIIDFIEKSSQYTQIKKHYTNLLISEIFELELKKIEQSNSQKATIHKTNCLIVYDQTKPEQIDLYQSLQTHLKIAGVDAKTMPLFKSEPKDKINFAINIDSREVDYLVWLPSPEIHKKLFYQDGDSIQDSNSSAQFPKMNYIYLAEYKNYYLFTFAILQKLLSQPLLDEISSKFKEQYERLLYENMERFDGGAKSGKAGKAEKTHADLQGPNAEESDQKEAFNNGNFNPVPLVKRVRLVKGISILFIIVPALCIGYWSFHRMNAYKKEGDYYSNVQAAIVQDSTINSKTAKMSGSPKSLLASQLEKGKAVTWNLPRQDHIFVGREKLLQELELSLNEEKHNKDENISPISISVCTGLGGIGKTQLALQFVHHTKNQYRLKAWFSAENIEQLSHKYIEFAKALGYDDEKSDLAGAQQYTKDWLAKHPGWLIVFDEAKNYREIEPFLPNSGGSVIITTRSRNWPVKYKTLPVGVMLEHEATTLISTLIERKVKDEEKPLVKDLAGLLGYLPLALAQAAAYIHQNQMPIGDYLKLYKKHEITLLTDNILPEITNTRTVAITWNITLDAMLETANKVSKSPIELELLCICAYLEPNKIPESLLLTWLELAHPTLTSPELELNKHIHPLWQYSLIDKNENGYLSIHRLVQAVVRHQHRHTEEGLRGAPQSLQWYNTLLEAADRDFNRALPVLVQEKRQNDLLPHLQSLVKHYALFSTQPKLDKSSSQSSSQLSAQTSVQSLGQTSGRLGDILTDMGTVYYRMSEPKSAQLYYEQALEQYLQHYGKNHPKVAIALRNMGNVYRLQEDKKAKEFLEQALAIQRQHYPENNLEVATTQVSLGNAYGDLGDAKKKKELLERALPIIERQADKDPLLMAQALHSLGRVFVDLGEYKKASPLFERALAIRETHYGPEHPQVAITLHNLANNYLELEDFQKAKSLFERALQIKQDYYGKKHTQVAITLHGLGRIHMKLGDFQKAKEMFEHSLAIKEHHYGKAHRQTAMVYHNLGITYKELKENDKALSFLKNALEINQQYFGPDHIKVAIVLQDLGQFYYESGDLNQARTALEQVLAIQNKYYGGDHVKLAKTLYILAQVQLSGQAYKEAHSMAKRAYNIFLEAHGKEHKDTKKALKLLLQCRAVEADIS